MTDWRQAVLDELIVAHIYAAEHDSNPRKAIKDAINWNVAIALDPQVSSDAQELIDRGMKDAAKICDEIFERNSLVADSSMHIEPKNADRMTANAAGAKACAEAIRAHLDTLGGK